MYKITTANIALFFLLVFVKTYFVKDSNYEQIAHKPAVGNLERNIIASELKENNKSEKNKKVLQDNQDDEELEKFDSTEGPILPLGVFQLFLKTYTFVDAPFRDATYQTKVLKLTEEEEIESNKILIEVWREFHKNNINDDEARFKAATGELKVKFVELLGDRRGIAMAFLSVPSPRRTVDEDFKSIIEYKYK